MTIVFDFDEMRNMQSAILTTGETARELGVSENMVRYWERRGVLTALKSARGRRIFLADHVRRFRDERAKKNEK